MSDFQRLPGTYLLGLEPMLVSVDGEEIRLRLTGVPEELAARLVGSNNSYVVVGRTGPATRGRGLGTG